MEKLISEILYELQPFRLEDVRIMINWSLELFSTLSTELYHSRAFFNSLDIKRPSNNTILIVLSWVVGYIVSIWMKIGSIYFILSLFFGIFLNLGVKKHGESSAYSVFNHGYQRILGTMTADQFEREIRHDNNFGIDDDNDAEDFEDDQLQQLQQQREQRDERKKKQLYRKKGKKTNRGAS